MVKIMTKKLKNLLSKWNVLAIALVAMMSVGMTSCSKDDPETPVQPPVQVVNGVTITNSSNISFRPLYIVYLNSGQEPLSTENLGDLLAGGSKTATFPQGTAYYYLAFNSNGTVYYTANHSSSETSFTITASTTWLY